jgi:hypothetical protein
MNLTLDAFRRGVRAAMYSPIRGGTVAAPRSTFAGADLDARNRLDKLHLQIRVATDARLLCDLVDEYLLIAATIARARFGAAQLVPGAVLQAAVTATESTGPVGPVVMGDNISVPPHSMA